jgi:hypothetical protein
MWQMKPTTKSRLIFWGRMTGWLGTGVVAPITTFAVKFGLFTKSEPVTDALGNVIQQKGIALNGWGIVCCLLIGSYIMQILKEVVDSNKGYSLTKQCYDGLMKLIPLIMAYGICYFLNGVLAQIMYCLAILIVCRAAAVPLNPLPKWRYDKTGEEDYSDLLGGLTEIVKQFKHKEG